MNAFSFVGVAFAAAVGSLGALFLVRWFLRRIDHLADEVTGLRHDVSQLVERVDFAERLLAERREHKLSAGQ